MGVGLWVYGAAMTELTREEATSFVEAVVQLASMADRVLPRRSSELAERLAGYLGGADVAASSVSMQVGEFERVNLQRALDAYQIDASHFEVIGLPPEIGNYGPLSLPAMVSGEWHGPGESAKQFTSVEVDVDETVDCLRSGLVLTAFEESPIVALVYLSEHRYPPQVVIEVVGADQSAADGFLRRLRELMQEHNAFRGRTISFSFGMSGEFGLRFVRLPRVDRSDVVLAPGELEAIEAHAIGISEHAEALRAAGQHVKRGLLLYGPPGTGKTHTISYLLGKMPERTTILLAGDAVSAVGQAGTIARQLQPATIVIEDVDLIGMDRELPGAGHNPLLFQLLNEMDGLAEDADVLFVLTTNRAEILEPALAARPGRIDQAIELSLPSAPARRQLLDLYTAGSSSDDIDSVVDRLEGAAPAFIKELARRAELVKLQRGSDVENPLAVALDEMMVHSSPILQQALSGPPGYL